MKKEVVADVPSGTVCRFKGEWGVMGPLTPNRDRRFDRWHGPAFALRRWELVDVPTSDRSGK